MIEKYLYNTILSFNLPQSYYILVVLFIDMITM